MNSGEEIRTTCPYCGVGCGLYQATVGRVTKEGEE